MSAVTKTCAVAAGMYCGMGLAVPIWPTAAACVAVVLVRILVWTKTRSIAWNLTVCGLAIVAAIVTVEGSSMNPFRAFWLGVGYGGLGVGIIEIGKSNILTGLKVGLQAAFPSMFGAPPPKE